MDARPHSLHSQADRQDTHGSINAGPSRLPSAASRLTNRLIRPACVLLAVAAMGASHRTPNFVVTAPTPEIAKQVGEAAEHYREALAIEWLGHKLRNWSAPCTVQVQVGQMGAGGATTFSFDRGQVFGWRMTLQGPLERILDSVLPHEVSHTIFACHFRRPLPRWADEGAATLAEHEGEQRRQTLRTGQILRNRRRIPLRKLMPMTEYPRDTEDVMTLYAQGYSLADFLVQQQGRTAYLSFIEDGHRRGWDKAIHSFYGFRDVDDLEQKWSRWVLAGSPPLPGPNDAMLAEAQPAEPAGTESEIVVRGQSPGEPGGHSPAAEVPAKPVNTPAARLLAGGGRQPLPRGSDLEAPAPRRQAGDPPSNGVRGTETVSSTGERGWSPIPAAERRPLPAPNRPLAEASSPRRGRTRPAASDDDPRFELPQKNYNDRSLQTPFRQVADGGE